MEALGMIEVYGYLTAVEALDSAVKAANVRLVEATKVKGGLVTIMVTGDVGATKAAIDAAVSAAARVGRVVSSHVIPRPAPGIELIVGSKPERGKGKTKAESQKDIELPDLNNQEPPKEKINAVSNDEQIVTLTSDINNSVETEKSEHKEINEKKASELTKEELEKMTVVNLRTVARELEISNMTKKEIRYATKDQLISAIINYLQEEH